MRILIAFFAGCLMWPHGIAAKEPENSGIRDATIQVLQRRISAPLKVIAKDVDPVRPKVPLSDAEVAAMVKAKLAALQKSRVAKAANRGVKVGLSPEGGESGAVLKAPAADPIASHWSYEGETGPIRWGKLNPAWARCDSGARQSPIDIRDGIRVELEPVAFDYKPSHFNVVDNGHTVQVSLGSGNQISVAGRTYDLMQFHFHRPSEEKINGRGAEMVAHLVHKDAEGRLAVVAVLMEEGNPHPLIQIVWNNLPLEKNESVAPALLMDISQILPVQREYYTYMGSLTTPPCSEGVLWIVLKQPIQASAQQMAIFARLYPMNARPVQALSGRLIKESN